MTNSRALSGSGGALLHQDALEPHLHADSWLLQLQLSRSSPRRGSRSPRSQLSGEWTINILILLFGTSTLVQPFIVPTPSMDTTVLIGDHLLVDKLAYAPPGAISKHFLPYEDVKRGDIIVFRYPMLITENYVKR